MFKACLKKDYLDQKRTNKFLMNVLVAVGMAAFTFLTMAIMKVTASQYGEMPAEFSNMFSLTYSSSLTLYMSFMVVYFSLVYIFRIKGTISKERKDKKWILPISAGIPPQKMIASKIVINIASILLAVVVASAFHFVGTIIFFKANLEAWKLLVAYIFFAIFTAFIVVLTVCVDAISNKPLVSTLVPILLIMVGGNILSPIKIGNSNLLNYSPFLFSISDSVTNMGAFSFGEWFSAGLSTVIISAVLIFFALKSDTIKAEKIK